MSLSPTNSLRILVLDGGGVKDYTSLLILKRIFRTIQDKGNLDEEPRACDVFDLIVGSSTRGLIAVMLGLLSMTIPDAIHQYEALGQRVFGKKVLGGVVGIAMKGIASHPLYDIATLQGCINDVLKDLRPPIPPDSPFCEVDNPRCKVYVVVRATFNSVPGSMFKLPTCFH
jgi:hypothetical protein